MRRVSAPQIGEKILVPHDEQRGHYAVTKTNDDGTVRVKHDETGHEMDLHADRFRDLLAHSHEEGLKARHTAEDALPHKGSARAGSKTPPTIDKASVYATILQGSNIKDHDLASADARYVDAKSRNRKVKLKPWKGGELDAFREQAGKAGKKFSSMREAFDHAMRGVKTWRDVQTKVIPLMRGVPGLENVHLPMDVLTRHAFQDRELQEHDEAFSPENYGTTVGQAPQQQSFDQPSPSPESGGEESGVESWWGKSILADIDLLKARFHKYLRRVPTGDAKRPYRYVYSIASEAHGGGPVVGEKVKVSDEGVDGHYEVKHVDEENVHLEHDETGKKLVVAKKHLHDMFSKEHVRNIATKHAQLQKIATAARISGTAGQIAQAVRNLDGFERTFGLQRHRPLPSPVNEDVERELGEAPAVTRTSAGKNPETAPDSRVALIREDIKRAKAGKEARARGKQLFGINFRENPASDLTPIDEVPERYRRLRWEATETHNLSNAMGAAGGFADEKRARKFSTDDHKKMADLHHVLADEFGEMRARLLNARTKPPKGMSPAEAEKLKTDVESDMKNHKRTSAEHMQAIEAGNVRKEEKAKPAPSAPSEAKMNASMNNETRAKLEAAKVKAKAAGYDGTVTDIDKILAGKKLDDAKAHKLIGGVDAAVAHKERWAKWSAAMDESSAHDRSTPESKRDMAWHHKSIEIQKKIIESAKAAGGKDGEERAARGERLLAFMEQAMPLREAQEKKYAEHNAAAAKEASEEAARRAAKAKPATDSETASKQQARREGAHLEGSKKDLSNMKRLVEKGDLDKLPYSDAARLVTKESAMPALPLEHFKTQGASPGGAHMALGIASLIAAKPKDDDESRRRYIDGVRLIAGSLANIKTQAEAEAFADELRNTIRNKGEEVLHALTPEEVKTYAGGNTHWNKTMDLKTGRTTVEAVEPTVEARRAANDLRDRLAAMHKPQPGGYVSIKSTKDGGYIIYRDNPAARADFAKTILALGPRFVSGLGLQRAHKEAGFKPMESSRGDTWAKLVAEAKNADTKGWEHLEERAAAPKEMTPRRKGTSEEKPKFQWKQTVSEVPDLKGTKVKIDAADASRLRSTFGLHGVQSGEAIPEADFNHHLRHSEMALHDLADVMGVDPKYISLNGRLGLAIAARGKGKARAHYEPGGQTDRAKKVINLTRFAGAGSLAHEWGHFLDNIIAESNGAASTSSHGAFASHGNKVHGNAELAAAVEGVRRAMNEHPDPTRKIAEHKAREKQIIEAMNKVTHEVNQAFYAASPTERRSGESEYSRKRTAGLALHEQLAEQLKEHRKMKPTASEFAHNAFALSGYKDGYYSKPHEMWARAWESFVQDKLEDNGRRNSYLVDGTRAHYEGFPSPYPQGEERKRVSAAFGNLIDVLKRGGHFEKSIGTRLVISLRKAG